MAIMDVWHKKKGHKSCGKEKWFQNHYHRKSKYLLSNRATTKGAQYNHHYSLVVANLGFGLGFPATWG